MHPAPALANDGKTCQSIITTFAYPYPFNSRLVHAYLVLCPARALAVRFALAAALPSSSSARALAPLFATFIGTMPASDFFTSYTNVFG